MRDSLSLGGTITRILKVLNINGRDLAKAINVDPSVVSRWKNDKRIFPTKSEYLQSITDYFYSSISSDFQEKEFRNIANNLNVKYSISNCDIRKLIYEILEKAHENSIKNNCLDSLNKKKSHEHNVDNNCNKNYYEYIVGHEKIMEAGFNLMASALNNTKVSEEPIIVTFFNEFETFCNCEDKQESWDEIVVKLLNKGYKVTYLVNLNENVERSLKILSDIKFFYISKSFNSVYLNNHNLFPFGPVETVIVPNVGVLFCMRISDGYRFDHAFLYRDDNAVEAFKGMMNIAIKNSTSLTEINRNIEEEVDGRNISKEIEDNPGKCFLIKDSLGATTLPYEVYERQLLKGGDPFNKNVEEVLSIFRERQENFKDKISVYEYYSIYRKDSIERFVACGTHPFQNRYSREDIIAHIKNVIYLLETYEKYNIALITESQHNKYNNLNCFIKEYQATAVYFDKVYLPKAYEDPKNFIAFISDQIVVNSFQSYFMNIWFKIEPEYRDKEKVIRWFKDKLKTLL